MINAAGGRGVHVRVDHTKEDEVRALFERVEREHGRLDVLANCVAGEDMRMAGWTSFWKTDLKDALAVFENALLTHVITAKHAAPLIRRSAASSSRSPSSTCSSSVQHLAQLVKFSIKGLASMMAEDLRKHRVAAVAITPGYLRSERMLEHFGVTEENWREGGEKDPTFLQSESPLFIGRAVAALAADPKVLKRTGDLTSSYELGREYGLTDYDGRRPDLGQHFVEHIIPSMKSMKEGTERHVAWLDRIAGRGRYYLGEKQETADGRAA